VYDVRPAGDDDPVPIRQRPEALALVAEPDPRRKLGLYAALSRQLAERAGPLVAVLIQARGAEPDLDRFASTVEAERLAGATALVTHLSECGGLRAGLSVESARDVLWTLISPEVYQLLVARRGWSPDDYQEWLGDAMAHALL
jgi:hypothetical protein